jgi:hypothetical protein
MDNIHSMGMKPGRLYETIITTLNQDSAPNAAPIGLIPKNSNKFVLYLFQGSSTLENIKREGKFTVNILNDPSSFVESTLGNPPKSSFQEHGGHYYLKNSDAFFTAQVETMKAVDKKDQIGSSQLNIVQARVEEIIQISDCVHPLNRAIYGIIEALIDLSRIDMVDSETRNTYFERLAEISRVVNRVGGPEDIEALKRIKKEFEIYR